MPFPMGCTRRTPVRATTTPCLLALVLACGIWQGASVGAATFPNERKLAKGDFAAINNLISDAQFAFADTIALTEILGSEITVNLTSIKCWNVSLADANFTFTPPNASASGSNASVVGQASIVDLNATCTLDYYFDTFLGAQSGGLEIYTSNSLLTTDMTLVKAGPKLPPTQAVMSNCQTVINVDELIFVRSSGSLLSLFESIFQDFVADEFGNILCTTLADIATTLSDTLATTATSLQPFLAAVSNSDSSTPLALEKSLTLPAGVLNLRDPGPSTVGTITSFVFDQMSGFLGETGKDDNDNGNDDLNINILVREILNGNGMDVDLALIQKFLNTTIEITSANLGRFSVVGKHARLQNLDGFTRFDDMTVLGNVTVAGGYAMQGASLLLDFDIEIEPNSITTKRVLKDTVTVEIKSDQVDLTGSLVAAIHEATAGAIPLGALVDSSPLLDAIANATFLLQAGTVDFAAFDLPAPIIQGLQSSVGLRRVFTTGVNFLLTAFRQVVPSALAGFAMTNDLADLLADFDFGRRRLASKDAELFVDFRDLFLKRQEAIAYGASGSNPYGTIFPWVKELLNDGVAATNPDTGKLRFNEIFVDPITEERSGQAGTYVLEDALVNIDTKTDIDGVELKLKLVADNIRIDNLNTVAPPIALLDPLRKEAYAVNNTASFAGDPIRATAYFSAGLEYKGMVIQNEFDVSLDIVSPTVVVTVLAKLAESGFLSFPIEDVFEVPCWLAAIPPPKLDATGRRVAGSDINFALTDLSLSIEEMALSIDCIECSGPLFAELETKLATNSSQEELTRVVNDAIDEYLKKATDGNTFLQVPMDRMLVDAPRFCPHRSAYDENAEPTEYQALKVEQSDTLLDFLIACAATVGAALLVACVAVIGVRFWVRRRHHRHLQTISRDEMLVMYGEAKKRRDDELEMNMRSKSLFRSECVPRAARFLVPVVLIANVGLFLSGHLNLGGAVRIVIDIAGQGIEIDGFYKFSIARSTIELWKAGGREIAILIAIFSGVWPYSKQFITLYLWFVPPRVVGVSRRGSILLWLDVLAKWSMLDVFTLIVSIVVFRIHISNPGYSFLPENMWTFDLMLQPLWGLYANALAQVLSQVSSHFIIFYHRRVEVAAREIEKPMILNDSDDPQAIELVGYSSRSPSASPRRIRTIDSASTVEDGQDKYSTSELNKSLDVTTQFDEAWNNSRNSTRQEESPVRVRDSSLDESTASEALNDHHFATALSTTTLRARRGVAPCIRVAALVSAALIITGCCLPSFQFKILGLLGLLGRLGDDSGGYQDHGITSILGLLWEQANFLATAKDYIGVAFLSGLVFLTTLVAPVVQAALLSVLWVVPLRETTSCHIEISIEVLQAWQFVEVYLLAVIVGVWQLGQISELLFNSYCDDLDATFDYLVSYGIIKPEDGQCFALDGAFRPGVWVLIAGALLLALLNAFVSQAVRQRRYERTLLVDRDPLVIKRMSTDAVSDASQDSESKMRSQIPPAPALFSDQFRWALTEEEQA